jgi:pseudaminic acid synthase
VGWNNLRVEEHMKIKDKLVGGDAPVFIVAELSANHNKNLSIALDTVRSARDSGADAIKLQHYKPETITIDCDNDYFRITQGTVWDGTTLFRLYETAYMPWEWTEEIMKVADECGLVCFSTPFDTTAVDYLERLDVPAYKIASYEITDVSLIEYVAGKKKPVLISTGIADMNDIAAALEVCRRMKNNDIALLKCTSIYPAPFEEMNLKTIRDMGERFNVVAGISDHTMGTSVPIAAVALGAKIIEKHLILNRSLGGPDALFSMEPKEFTAMTRAVRDTEKALGSVTYDLSEKARKSREHSRSLFVVKDLARGGLLTEGNVRSIRPGFGLHPKHIAAVLGKRVNRDVRKGTPLTWEMLME